jgi:predicted DNA-binding antitoxin AbrB/MazE fold protein
MTAWKIHEDFITCWKITDHPVIFGWRLRSAFLESTSTMKPIHAHYKSGIFRPTESVDLPDPCEVVFVPQVVESPSPSDLIRQEIYKILSHNYETGQTDLAARHDELNR